MIEIKSLTIDELKSALKEMGEKPFRAGQIFKWLHEGVESFEEMSNLSKDLRARLAENFLLTVPEVARKQVSRVDGTVKYLWRLRDGNCVESVLMHYEHGVSVCVSTQVGCRMGCKFCASGLNGRTRSLSAGEILDEILFMEKDSGEKVSNRRSAPAPRSPSATFPTRSLRNISPPASRSTTTTTCSNSCIW